MTLLKIRVQACNEKQSDIKVKRQSVKRAGKQEDAPKPSEKKLKTGVNKTFPKINLSTLNQLPESPLVVERKKRTYTRKEEKNKDKKKVQDKNKDQKKVQNNIVNVKSSQSSTSVDTSKDTKSTKKGHDITENSNETPNKQEYRKRVG